MIFGIRGRRVARRTPGRCRGGSCAGRVPRRHARLEATSALIRVGQRPPDGVLLGDVEAHRLVDSGVLPPLVGHGTSCLAEVRLCAGAGGRAGGQSSPRTMLPSGPGWSVRVVPCSRTAGMQVRRTPLPRSRRALAQPVSGRRIASLSVVCGVTAVHLPSASVAADRVPFGGPVKRRVRPTEPAAGGPQFGALSTLRQCPAPREGC